MNDLIVEQDGGVARAIFNRPSHRNPLTLAMRTELRQFIRASGQDPAVRCIVLTGAGGNFMSGGDVQAFGQALNELDSDGRQAFFEDRIATLPVVVDAIQTCPKPVIAAVRGACAGLGMGLMLACDLAYAADDAFFTTAYIKIAAPPDGGLSHSLPALVGRRKAAQLLMLGDQFDAAAALDLGLVNDVFPASEFDQRLAKLTGRLAAGPTKSLALIKSLLREAPFAGQQAQMSAERLAFAEATKSADFTEGVRAFLEKRRPSFSGT